jgi:predicted nucleic acid-binding protein
MRVFLDANILMAVLNKELNHFTNCARVLSLVDQRRFAVYTSPMCLAIAFYFASKKSGIATAKQKLKILCDKLHITQHQEKDVERIMSNKKILDLEDGLEYYSALSSKCQYIVSLDVKDFHFSEIPVLLPQDFLLQHVV